MKGVQTENPACTIELADAELDFLVDESTLLSDVSVVWGERFRFYEEENFYITTIKVAHNERFWAMKSTKDFSHSTIFMLEGEEAIEHVLGWLSMVAFGQACLLHQAVLIHASAVIWQGKGYAFLGKSGTGKSTHSKLWLAHIQGAELVNDDNPALRIGNDGEVTLYGTPWSGKTHCYKNLKVPLHALVRLKQATINRMVPKKGVEALLAVLPSCTAIRWNRKLFADMTTTVQAIVQKVNVAELENLPNKEAVVLCKTQLLYRKNKINIV